MSHKLSRIDAGLVLASILGICATVGPIGIAAADIIDASGLTIISAPSTVTKVTSSTAAARCRNSLSSQSSRALP